MPERYKYHEEKEQALIKKIFEKTGKKVSILTRTINKKKINITLKELRESVENQITFCEMNEFGGCGCFDNLL